MADFIAEVPQQPPPLIEQAKSDGGPYMSMGITDLRIRDRPPLIITDGKAAGAGHPAWVFNI
ncbi:hypothetical protein CK203_050808 [Vitis vinifera]|uniref:Uncharacterized protein n=1 Tax=Vitis vinifera TaxID=29760 RepID=A0A438HCI8_VITVI|nr:hypothetical protein CK203_050808 [Vitis vinifera]